MVKKRRAGDSTQMLRVDADDNFALVLQFENGAIGSIHYSATAAHEPSDLIVVSGAEGTLVLTSDGRLQAGRRGELVADTLIPDQYIRGASSGPHPLIHPTVYLLKQWAAAIRSGTTAIALLRGRIQGAGGHRRDRPIGADAAIGRAAARPPGRDGDLKTGAILGV